VVAFICSPIVVPVAGPDCPYGIHPKYTHMKAADCLLQEFEQKIVALDERNGFLPFHGSVKAALGAGLLFLFVGFSDVAVAVGTINISFPSCDNVLQESLYLNAKGFTADTN
jgi:hypothetical protein